MIELDAGVAQQLAEEATPSSAIQVRVGTSNSELIIASILQPLIQGFEMRGAVSYTHLTLPTNREV